MAVERTPEDPNDEPTRMADYGRSGNYGEPVPPPTPWYLRPAALVGLGVLTAILITALVWVMVRLVAGDDGHSVTTSVSSTAVAPIDESTAPSTGAPETTGPEDPALSQTTTSAAPSTTETTTETTTAGPTSTAQTTTAPSTTTVPSSTAAPTTTTPATPAPSSESVSP